MSRSPRFIQPGQPLHIMQRGNNRCVTFSRPGEFAFYLRLVSRVAKQTRCDVHAFVLMTNHVHLLVTPASKTGPSLLMKSVSEEYARYFNRMHRRTGTLWEGRYRSSPVDSDSYFFACSRYIELNPVRAGLSSHPSKYPWSSFRQNAEDAEKTLVSAHELYMALAATESGRREAYNALFDRPLAERTVKAIRYVIAHRPRANGDSFHNDREAEARNILRGMPSGSDAADWLEA